MSGIDHFALPDPPDKIPKIAPEVDPLELPEWNDPGVEIPSLPDEPAYEPPWPDAPPFPSPMPDPFEAPPLER